MADGEHGFLGLTRNPFATDSQEFFEGADRLKCLEKLRHLGQWSRQITLVTGPLGIGKTTLFRQLSMTLEPRVKAARINGVLVNTLRDVLHAVAQGVGAPVGTDATPQVLAEVLAAFFIGQERQGRIGLILVDDAHLLDYGSIEELLKLTRNSPVRLCLFGEPALVNAITRPAQRQELSWHELRLNAFDQEGLRSFVDWKLASAGYRGKLPFSASQLSKLLKISGGLPAQINQIGAELIDRLESGQPEARTSGFPVAHGLIVVLLVVVVSLAYLILSGIEPEMAGTRPQGEVATTTLKLPGTPGASTGESEADAARDTGTETTATDNEVVTVPVDAVADEAALIKPEPPAPVLTPMPEPADLQARKEAAEGATAAAVPARPSSGESVVPVTKPAEQPVSAVPVAAPPVSLPGSMQGSRDAEWLLAQPSASWTVQLASFSTEERLRAYLASQKDRRAFAWYPIERGGKRLFVVTIGQYGSKAEAEAAAKQLPPETGKVEPWVRPMSMVKDAINASAR